MLQNITILYLYCKFINIVVFLIITEPNLADIVVVQLTETYCICSVQHINTVIKSIYSIATTGVKHF
jgi:hypothetical protein